MIGTQFSYLGEPPLERFFRSANQTKVTVACFWYLSGWEKTTVRHSDGIIGSVSMLSKTKILFFGKNTR